MISMIRFKRAVLSGRKKWPGKLSNVNVFGANQFVPMIIGYSPVVFNSSNAMVASLIFYSTFFLVFNFIVLFNKFSFVRDFTEEIIWRFVEIPFFVVLSRIIVVQ